MPIYEYVAEHNDEGCSFCRVGFEHLESLRDPPLEYCPKCGGRVKRQISAPSLGSSKSGLDDRAKNAGFHKLKKIGFGEYEKQY